MKGDAESGYKILILKQGEGNGKANDKEETKQAFGVNWCPGRKTDIHDPAYSGLRYGEK